MITQDIMNLINEETKFEDLNDYWETLRKNGFTNEKKLKGMFNKAKEIAKDDDKQTIIGIVQSFLLDK